MINRKGGLGLLSLLLLAPLALATSSPSSAVDYTTSIYMGPKVNQPGTTTEPSAEAGGLGSANLTGSATVSAVTVESRASGTTMWGTANGIYSTSAKHWVYFKGFACCEYRAKWTMGNGDIVYSAIKTYTWRSLFVDEFDDGNWDDTWNMRAVTNTTEGNIIPGCTNVSCNKADPDFGATTAIGAPGDPNVVETDVLSMSIKDPTPSSYTPGEPMWGVSLAADDPNIAGEQDLRFTDFWAAARVKMRKPEGAHDAFWMNSKCNEVDVYEFFPKNRTYPERQPTPPADSADNKITHTAFWNEDRCDGYANDSMKRVQQDTTDINSVYPGEEWYDEWHVLSIRWTADASYQVYVDDKKVWTYTGPAVAKAANPLNILLSFQTKSWEHDGDQAATGGTCEAPTWSCIEAELDPTDLPLVSKVDWVQVWDN